jgi:hypothetical protein
MDPWTQKWQGKVNFMLLLTPNIKVLSGVRVGLGTYVDNSHKQRVSPRR